jgi:hypothetical protein
MSKIIWTASGFYIVKRFPNDTNMKNDYFMTTILIRVEQAIFPRGRAPPQKRLIIHLDNRSVCTGQTSKAWLEKHSIRRMPHPSYSPDLAPSDFYLFPTVKAKLEWIQVADNDQFV